MKKEKEFCGAYEIIIRWSNRQDVVLAEVDGKFYFAMFNYITGNITGNRGGNFAKLTDSGFEYVSTSYSSRQSAIRGAKRWYK